MKLVMGLLLSLSLVSCSNDSEDSDKTAAHDHADHQHEHDMGENAAVGEAVAAMADSAYAKISFNEDALKSGAENLHTASVMFSDSEGEMLSGVTIESVEPWMKTMGHGSNDEQLDFHQHDDMGHHWMITGIIFSWVAK